MVAPLWNSHPTMMATSEEPLALDMSAIRFATLSDAGTLREHNEDACGTWIETASEILMVVADGVSGAEGGEIREPHRR